MTGGFGGGHLGLLFDGALALLLMTTIVYAALLNRKLTDLRAAKQDMERLLAGFAESTERADVALKLLRDAAGETGEHLQDGITKGNAVADDLVFLIERAGTLADRLETPRGPGAKTGMQERGGVASRPNGGPASGGTPETAKAAGPDGPESALIEALRGVR